MLVPSTGVLQQITTLEEREPEAAGELVRLALYEAMCDEADRVRPALEHDVAKAALDRAPDMRRALVRVYINKRMSGADVDEVLRAAAHLTVAEVAAADRISKSWKFWQYGQKPGQRDPGTGQFVHAGQQMSNGQVAVSAGPRNSTDVLQRFTDSARDTPEQQFAHQVAEGLTDDSRYKRLSTAGRALHAMSKPGSPTSAAGSVARLVGDLGPEAETVLGKPLRRTAYRYRGTEKRPSATLVRDVALADELAGAPPEAFEEHLRTPKRPGGGFDGPAGALAAAHHSFGRGAADVEPDSDQALLRSRGDAAVAYYLRKLPDAGRTAISLAAGRVPPSQGAIIDANGDVTSEAQGFAGDHFLPFDLKNLKRLHGGQYVRTRASGGPTTEDIYTGILTGARQVQVVSNSGVFTLELDPELRGGRRYSDKARAMVGRYQRILDAIDKSSDLYANDIDDDAKAELRQKAYTQVGGGDSKAVGDRYTALLQEARTKASWEKTVGDADLTEAINHRLDTENIASPVERAARGRELKREMLDKANEKAVRRFRLDGEGYHEGLQALKQEFPYFIRDVKWQPLQSFADDRSLGGGGGSPENPLPKDPGPDTGYVQPGRLAPAGLRDKPHYSEKPVETKTDGGGDDEASAGAAAGGGKPKTPQDGGGTGAAHKLPTPILATLASTTPLTKAVDAKRDEVTTKLASALGPLVQVMTDYDRGADIPEGTPDEAKLAHPTPGPFIRDAMVKAGDPRKLAQWLLDPKTPPKALEKFIEGAEQAPGVLRAQENADQLFGDQPGALFKPAQLEAAKQALETAYGVRQPFADIQGIAEPAFYLPQDDHALPLNFEEINRLGTRAENYDAFITAARENPEFAAALDKMSQAQNDAARVQLVKGSVEAFKNAQKLLADPSDNPELPNNLPEGVKDKASAGQYLSDPTNKRGLHWLQAAWSLGRAHDVATLLGGGTSGQEGGGGGAPGPKALTQGPADPSQALPGFGKRLEVHALSKREGISRRTLVRHPYDSPVSKALRDLLAGCAT